MIKSLDERQKALFTALFGQEELNKSGLPWAKDIIDMHLKDFEVAARADGREMVLYLISESQLGEDTDLDSNDNPRTDVRITVRREILEEFLEHFKIRIPWDASIVDELNHLASLTPAEETQHDQAQRQVAVPGPLEDPHTEGRQEDQREASPDPTQGQEAQEAQAEPYEEAFARSQAFQDAQDVVGGDGVGSGGADTQRNDGEDDEQVPQF